MSQHQRWDDGHTDLYTPFRPVQSSASSNVIIPRDYLGPRSEASSPRSATTDVRGQTRRPIPSPLQSIQFPMPSPKYSGEHTPQIASFSGENSPSPRSQPALRPGNGTTIKNLEQIRLPQSPKDRLEDLLATDANHSSSNPEQPGASASPGDAYGERDVTAASDSSASTTPFCQQRQASFPMSNPPPVRPRQTSTPMIHSANTTLEPFSQERAMPRTSSIDSAISSISSNASHAHKTSFDSIASNPADIANLINAAGSTENLIQHLLKDKQHATHQNTQLWRLVEKQRALIIGLNKDLDRAAKDKERYRKKLKEVLGQPQTPADQLAKYSSQNESVTQLPPKVTSTLNSSTKGATTSTFESRDVARPPQATSDSVATTESPQNRGIQPLQRSHTIDSVVSSNAPRVELQSPIKVLPPNLSKVPAEDEQSSNNSRNDVLRVVTPLNSFTNKRLLPRIECPPNTSSSTVAEGGKTPSNARKGPPAPLDLSNKIIVSSHLAQVLNENDESTSEYDDELSDDEEPEFQRGRRKTREEDDEAREAIALRNQDTGNGPEKTGRSKSNAQPPAIVQPQHAPDSVNPPQMVPQSPPTSTAGLLPPAQSLASVLNMDANGGLSPAEPLLSLPPKSPGLPNSPRPADRPVNSPLPRLPKDGALLSMTSSQSASVVVGLPSSPKAVMSLPQNRSDPVDLHMNLDNNPKPERGCPDPQIMEDSHSTNPESDMKPSRKPVFHGFMSDQYPGLLLPPAALAIIDVKVLSLQPQQPTPTSDGKSDRESIFLLAIVRRSSNEELWRIERNVTSLLQLDYQLKKTSTLNPQFSDSDLFKSHIISSIDAGRNSIANYFAGVLQTHLDDKATISLCQYLSAGATPPINVDRNPTLPGNGGSKSVFGKPKKEGYLKKRGKNFGGWKARYFVLDGPDLRYYEALGGPHLGNIRLQHAQISKKVQTTAGDSAKGTDDVEDELRHTFVILEPKRKDSNSHVRHILCAEDDADRDEWVDDLQRYVQDDALMSENSVPEPPQLSKPVDVRQPSLDKKSSPKGSGRAGSQLVGVSYAETVAAEAPVCGPTSTSQEEAVAPAAVSKPNYRQTGISSSSTSKSISGPTNGVKIEDAGAWGNKPATKITAKEKEQRKRSIWGFKSRSSGDLLQNQANDASTSLGAAASDKRVTLKPVFGMPLAEAVEFCGPVGLDVNLPAVVYRSIEYLRAKNAANEEGIFRLSGSANVVKAIRERFNTEGDVDILAENTYYDVHAIASLLKSYLRELPASVLTRDLHLDFLGVLSLDSASDEKISTLNCLVHRLPKANYTLLRTLSSFLIDIINRSDVNKMTIRNVGIVFSPSLNIPAPLVSFFLTDFETIFDKKPIEKESTGLSAPSRDLPTIAEARSPRRQVFSEIGTPTFNHNTFAMGNKLQDPLTPDQRATYDTGFAPGQAPRNQNHHSTSHSEDQVVLPNPEQMARHSMVPLNSKSDKSRRRESSMLFMNFGMGNKKSPMPKVREDSPIFEEEKPE